MAYTGYARCHVGCWLILEFVSEGHSLCKAHGRGRCLGLRFLPLDGSADIGSQEGHWDLRGRFDDYISRISVGDKSVLDVGTASGFLSFEAEKRGAKVVSIDASTAMRWDRVPFIESMHALNDDGWLVRAEKYLDDIKRSYWLAHRELKSANRVYYGNAYELPSELGSLMSSLLGKSSCTFAMSCGCFHQLRRDAMILSS